MVKKLIIEKDDEPKMLEWEENRLAGFREKYNALNEGEEVYVVAVDIAGKDSVDFSVMSYFKLVNGEYVFERSEKI